MASGLLVALLLSVSDKASFTAIHDAALRRAHVWEEPATSIADAKLDRNPDGPRPFGVDEVVDCTFKPGGAAGSTPKFDQELPGGERVKVKYGRSNAGGLSRSLGQQSEEPGPAVSGRETIQG